MTEQDKIDLKYNPYKYLVKSVCVAVLGSSPVIKQGEFFKHNLQIEAEAVKVAKCKGFSDKKTKIFIRHCLQFAPIFCSVVVDCDGLSFVVREGLNMPE